jgi:hypothetical protein
MASRRLKIMFVTKTESECKTLVDGVRLAMKELHPDIVVEHGRIVHTRFPDFRCDVVFNKVQGITWNQYYKAVNSVKPVPFDFI